MKPSYDDELLLNAHLDGEFDAIEARLAGDPALTGEVEARRALRAALRADLAEDLPSASCGAALCRHGIWPACLNCAPGAPWRHRS